MLESIGVTSVPQSDIMCFSSTYKKYGLILIDRFPLL